MRNGKSAQVESDADPQWPGEILIPVGGGCIATDSAHVNPHGSSYVRILDKDRREIAYWSFTEWAEQPEEVMGAIMGAICGQVKGGKHARKP